MEIGRVWHNELAIVCKLQAFTALIDNGVY